MATINTLDEKKKLLDIKRNKKHIELKDAQIEIVKSSIQEKDYYKDNAFKMLGITFFLFLTLIGSGYYAYYSYFIYEPPVSFIALDEDNKILEEIPINEDVKSEEELNQWASEGITKIFDYNYLTFDKHGAKIKDLFSNTSYTQFMETFNNLKLQKRVEAQKAIVSPRLLKSMEISQEGTLLDRKAWMMKGELLLNIHGAEGLERVRRTVEIVVVRTTFKENREGVVFHEIKII